MGPGQGTPTKTYEFTLRYAGPADDYPDEWADALFEAGCDDACLGIREGLIFLDFHREAASFQEALLSAIADVDRSALPIRLVRVEPV